MQKLELKSISMLCKSCWPSHTEHNKIGFAIFGFLCDFKWILQFTAKAHQRGRIFLALGSLELFNFTTLPSVLATSPSNPKNPHRGTLDGGRRLAAGVVGPGLANKRHLRAVQLTSDRFVCLVGLEMSTVSGDNGAEAALPRLLEVR
jgi:hypothetical protein